MASAVFPLYLLTETGDGTLPSPPHGIMGTGLGSAAVAAPSTGGPGGKRREYLVGFAVSSASPALAAVATNPIEVVKVRQQMQTIQNA